MIIEFWCPSPFSIEAIEQFLSNLIQFCVLTKYRNKLATDVSQLFAITFTTVTWVAKEPKIVGPQIQIKGVAQLRNKQMWGVGREGSKEGAACGIQYVCVLRCRCIWSTAAGTKRLPFIADLCTSFTCPLCMPHHFGSCKNSWRSANFIDKQHVCGNVCVCVSVCVWSRQWQSM